MAGDRRFIGKYAAFDVVLSIILGSTLSRAINGKAPFYETLGASLILVGMHWLFAAIAFRFESFDTLIKGHSRILLREGQFNRHALRKSHLSRKDLESALRLNCQLNDVNRVELACLESSGDISVIPKQKPPRIIEVKVEKGVEIIRIQLE